MGNDLVKEVLDPCQRQVWIATFICEMRRFSTLFKLRHYFLNCDIFPTSVEIATLKVIMLLQTSQDGSVLNYYIDSYQVLYWNSYLKMFYTGNPNPCDVWNYLPTLFYNLKLHKMCNNFILKIKGYIDILRFYVGVWCLLKSFMNENVEQILKFPLI